MDDDPAAGRARGVNDRYEERFGFRFVVFVDRRPKAEILPVLRERLERTRGRGARHRALRARGNRPRPVAAQRDDRRRWTRILVDWLDLALRWLHVIAAVVWIGTSFYFVALDNHLAPNGRRRGRRRRRVVGDPRRRLLPRPEVPCRAQRAARPLHWFKWRRIRRGSPGSRSSASSTTSTPTTSSPSALTCRSGGDRDLRRIARRGLAVL